MTKIEFGQLIATLRRNQYLDSNQKWTQGKLAQKLTECLERTVTVNMVSKLERGVRLPDPDLLEGLSQVFALTSGERQQFFLAAVNISADGLHSSQHDEAKVKKELLKRLGELQLPAYIIDRYCDIVATNMAVARLLEIEAAGLELSALPRPNMLDFVFSPKAVDYYQPRMAGSWENYTYQNIMLFRTLTLRYRTTARYQQLFERLWEYPKFQYSWMNAPLQERDFYTNNEYINFSSTGHGVLRFFSTSFTALSTAGKLYFSSYVPASLSTAQRFATLMAEGGNKIWPQP